MEYIYMQKPIPANVKGVSVTISAVYPDGTSHTIDTVEADMSGMFKKLWTPPTEGEYTIVATFGGSESFWPSYAETAVGVGTAPVVSTEPITPGPTATGPSAVPTTTPPGPEGGDQTVFFVAVAAVVIIIVVVAAAVLLRRRK